MSVAVTSGGGRTDVFPINSNQQVRGRLNPHRRLIYSNALDVQAIGSTPAVVTSVVDNGSAEKWERLLSERNALVGAPALADAALWVEPAVGKDGQATIDEVTLGMMALVPGNAFGVGKLVPATWFPGCCGGRSTRIPLSSRVALVNL